ncbi:MAG: hypothetical protein JRI23_31285 [Deltaproteobacteria bacterium]|jgi:hypothetical protein|nr:hypothetical protein [Deltaproteobacteria bacterium]MBW2536687.1 hypothetical protein [Deltaproteobacteria bacterium]
MSESGDDAKVGGETEGKRSPVTLARRETDAAAKNQEPSSSTGSEDVVFVHSPCESGEGFNVIRQRSNRLEVGELRTPKEGKPLVGELVKLTPRRGQERLFDVEVLVDGVQATAGRSGPAKVSSAAYRANWDGIFRRADGSRSEGDDPPN